MSFSMDNETRAKLIQALTNEWEYLCHEDPDPDDDTPEEYNERLLTLTDSQLIDEADINEGYTLEHFLEYWYHD